MLQSQRQPEVTAEDATADEPAPCSGHRLTTSSGASVTLREQAFELRDRHGRLVFEYDADTGHGSLSMPEGDLCLKAPRGNIELQAAGTLRLGAKHVAMTGERADITFADATYRAVRLNAAVEQAHVVLGHLEQVASSVLLRARRVVRQIEGLEHTTAGRIRSLVQGAYSLKAGRAAIIADDEVKLDGARIELG
jgi:hypothetical protein